MSTSHSSAFTAELRHRARQSSRWYPTAITAVRMMSMHVKKHIKILSSRFICPTLHGRRAIVCLRLGRAFRVDYKIHAANLFPAVALATACICRATGNSRRDHSPNADTFHIWDERSWRLHGFTIYVYVAQLDP